MVLDRFVKAPLPSPCRRASWKSTARSLAFLLLVVFVLVVALGGPSWSSRRLLCADETREREGASVSSSLGSSRSLRPPASYSVRLERQAIERGLGYLRSKAKSSGAVGSRYPVAVTSLAGLAFMGAGYTYSYDGPYSRELKECLGYLLHQVQGGYNSGYISEIPGSDESRMHGHCFAVLFLTQIYGELPPELQTKVGGVIHSGVKRILKAQSSRGGWTYYPVNRDDDDEASVTIGALQALRAARNNGFFVPKSNIDRAVTYVRDCQLGDGSFRYSIHRRETRSSFALTAAAVSTLQAAGEYHAREIQRGLDSMRKRFVDARRRPEKTVENRQFFFYASLYASQVYFQVGGDDWTTWYNAIREYLLRKQQPDGSWEDDYGSELGTAMAVLILEIPIRYLPIFQR